MCIPWNMVRMTVRNKQVSTRSVNVKSNSGFLLIIFEASHKVLQEFQMFYSLPYQNKEIMKKCKRVWHYVPKSLTVFLCPLNNTMAIISTILYYNICVIGADFWITIEENRQGFHDSIVGGWTEPISVLWHEWASKTTLIASTWKLLFSIDILHSFTNGSFKWINSYRFTHQSRYVQIW